MRAQVFKRENVLEGTIWITSPRKIALHYLFSTWFFIDLLSILVGVLDVFGDEGIENLVILRLVRVARLTKLIRLMRGSRIFKRWEMTTSINYAYLSLAQITIAIIVCSHWIACIWGLQASFDPLGSWTATKEYCTPWDDDDEAHVRRAVSDCSPTERCEVGSCSDGLCRDGYKCVDAWSMFTYSLYFAVMTITSVG